MDQRTDGRWLAGRWMGVFILVGVAACAGKGGPAQLRPAVYPPPPDTARVQFLTFITSEQDLGRKGRSVLQRVVGAQERSRKAIAKPYGLSLHRGRIYVCDQDILGVDVVDLQRGEISFFQPKDPYAVRRATNCFVDTDGTLYVADPGSKQVIAYDSTGTYVARFGMEDEGNPVDVFVAGDRIYVSHLSGRLKVRVYDRVTKAPLFGFPDVTPDDSVGLAAPANLFVAGDHVYVTDMLKQQLFVYTTEGTWVRTIGRPGLGPATFQRPKGVAVDRDGLIYVVDGGFDNVQVFNQAGRLLMFFGGPGQEPGNMVLPAKVVIDYEHLEFFRSHVEPGRDLKYLIFVTNQFGPWKIGVYGFVGPTGSPGP